MKEIKTTEIARSFSYKMSLPGYENRDFFCSQKAEVPKGKEEEISEALYKFCKKEVMKSVAEYKKEDKEQLEIKEVIEPIKPVSGGATFKEPYLDRKFHQDLMEDDNKEDYQRNNK